MNSTRGATRRNLTLERILRVAGALAVALLGFWVVSWTLAQLIAPSDPVRAHRLAPSDGRIAGRLAATLLERNPANPDRQAIRTLAERALRQDATTVTAATSLGLLAQLNGDAPGSRRWFSYSKVLSRRNLATQLWAIEDEVGRGNVVGALRHYDVALRVEPAAADFLFPILAAAASDPAVRTPLVRLLVTHPIWSENFLGHMGASGPNPLATAQLFMALRRAGSVVPEIASARVIDRLLENGRASEAWNYYATIRTDVRRTAARDSWFNADLATPTRFDWNPVEAVGITTSIQRSVDGGVFEYAAAPSVGGQLLWQEQMFPPGRYRLEGRVSDLGQPASERPYWTLSCKGNPGSIERELGRVALPSAVSGDTPFVGYFVVPQGCPRQMLAFVAVVSDGASGLTGQLRRVRLAAVSVMPQ